MFISAASINEVTRLRDHVIAYADEAKEHTYHDGSEYNSYTANIAGVKIELFMTYSQFECGYTFVMRTPNWLVGNRIASDIQVWGAKKQYHALMADIGHMKRFGDLGVSN